MVHWPSSGGIAAVAPVAPGPGATVLGAAGGVGRRSQAARPRPAIIKLKSPARQIGGRFVTGPLTPTSPLKSCAKAGTRPRFIRSAARSRNIVGRYDFVPGAGEGMAARDRLLLIAAALALTACSRENRNLDTVGPETAPQA